MKSPKSLKQLLQELTEAAQPFRSLHALDQELEVASQSRASGTEEAQYRALYHLALALKAHALSAQPSIAAPFAEVVALFTQSGKPLPD